MPDFSKKITAELTIADKETALLDGIKNVAGFKKAVTAFLPKNVSELSTIILGGGIILNASDLHIEPEEEQAKIRTRLDGLLQDVAMMNKDVYSALLSRIKLLAGIKLNVSDRPQDGRFSVLFARTVVEIRCSTLPAEYGEAIVLRILNPKNLIELGALGLRPDLLETFGREIKKPNGMILVTGPTGSGKTTTLYAFLKKIQRPELKIITIEDPIEYHLAGVSQTQTDDQKGYDFASGLKSIVRQDPDVILVGEIRDKETALIALQASLTGHLVFSTLHTNDASGAIPRLTSLGAEIANIAPALNMVVAQRLVRKVCQKCVRKKKIDPALSSEFKKALRGLPKSISFPKLSKDLKIPVAQGCLDCNRTGFSGRIGVYECFIVDSEMEKSIMSSPSAAELKEKAIKKGMVTMYQDGLIRVLEGKTTLEEVKKSVGE